MQHFSNPDVVPNIMVMTFADVLQAVEASNGLTPGRKRDLRSALKTFSNWCNLPLTEIPASFKSLRDRLSNLNPALVGVTAGRFANVRSGVAAGLELAGAPKVRWNLPISTQWKEVIQRARLTGDKYSLSKFARFCTLAGVTPVSVNDICSAQYLVWLEQASAVEKPREKHQSLCRAWNRLVVESQEQCLQALNVPSYRDGYGLSCEAFPASFQNDVDAYYRFLTNSDVLSDHAHHPPLRPVTANMRMKQAYAAASALVHSGVAIEEITNLGILVEIENARRILTFYHDRHGKQKTKMLSDIAESLFKIAYQYLRLADDALNPLRDFKKNVKVKQNGMTDKNRKLLRAFNDPAKVEQLKSLPIKKIDAVEANWQRTAKSGANIASNKLAIEFQKALAILILQYAPMRARNLAHLHMDRHLNWHILPGRLVIEMPGEEVKNHEPLTFELPEQVTRFIRRYIENYRPALLRGSNSYLFPGENGRPKSENNLSQQIAKVTQDELGLRMTAHQWRHVMGKIFLDTNPGQYEVLRRVLGHKSIETTMAYYAGEETISALRHYHGAIDRKAEERLVGHSSRARDNARHGPAGRQSFRPARTERNDGGSS